MDPRTTATALARAAMAHRNRAAALLADVGLHPGQEFLLSTLDAHGPLSVGELAARLGVEQPTVTRTLGRIDDRGWVVRTPDPDDGRRVLLSLTDAGRDVLARAGEAWTRLEAETTATLTREEAALLRDLLVRVRSGLLEAGGSGPCDPDDASGQ